MSVTVDGYDITKYVLEFREGRGYKINARKYDLALKPGSLVFGDQQPGYEFSLSGKLWADTKSGLLSLIDEFQRHFRARKEKYYINYNDKIYYGRCVSLIIREDNTFAPIADWEATFLCDDPGAIGDYETIKLPKDTIALHMNNGVADCFPIIEKVTSGDTVIFRASDPGGAIVASCGDTFRNKTVDGFGTCSQSYKHKLTDIRCLKWSSGEGHANEVGGLEFSPGGVDISGNNAYTLWFALWIDKDLITSTAGIRVGIDDGAHYTAIDVTDRVISKVWSWVPVFVREFTQANSLLDLTDIQTIYLRFRPNSSSNVDAYIDGHLLVREPARVSLTGTACLYDCRSGKAYSRSSGLEVDVSPDITGKFWARPGATLFYQNSNSSTHYVRMRSGK